MPTGSTARTLLPLPLVASSARAAGASGTPTSLIWLRCRSSSSRKSRGARAPASVEAPAPARLAAPSRLPSKPVAMTVIATSSPSRSLKLVPKMMFASGSAAERISSAASVTSNSDRFDDPERVDDRSVLLDDVL